MCPNEQCANYETAWGSTATCTCSVTVLLTGYFSSLIRQRGCVGTRGGPWVGIISPHVHSHHTQPQVWLEEEFEKRGEKICQKLITNWQIRRCPSINSSVSQASEGRNYE